MIYLGDDGERGEGKGSRKEREDDRIVLKSC